MKHVLRVRPLLLLIVVLGVCMECARTMKYVSYCKTRAREHNAALARCRKDEKSVLVEEPAKIRAIHDDYYRGHKEVYKETSKKIEALCEKELARPDINDDDRQKIAQHLATRKQKEAEWERHWQEEAAENEVKIRELAQQGKIAHVWADYHARQGEKYTIAAKRPWKWLSPDEPEPHLPIFEQDLGSGTSSLTPSR